MKISYKREMRHNYLIIEAPENREESYETHMLAGNSIEGFLKFRVRQEEKSRYYYYEITSKQPLERLLEFRGIRKDEISRLIIGIGAALNRMEDFLLREGGILLEPDQIYVDPDTFQIWLCYVPGYEGSFPEAVGKLLQYLLKKADHQDPETVVLAYGLFQAGQKDYFGIQDLLDVVKRTSPADRVKPGGELEHIENTERSSGGEWQDVPPGEGAIGRRAGRSVGQSAANQAGWDTGGAAERYAERDLESGSAAAEDRDLDFQADKSSGSGKSGRRLLLIPAFAVGSGAAVYLLAGMAGIRQWGSLLAAANLIVAAAILLTWLRTRKKSGKEKKEQRPGRGPKSETGQGLRSGQESGSGSWQMRFEEDDREGRDNPDEGGGWEKQAGLELKEGGSSKEGRKNRDESGLRGQAAGTESAAGAQKEKRPSGSTAVGNTVLLTDLSGSREKSHLLKSLSPAAADIPVPYTPFVIGKADIADHILNMDTVSRLHLRIDEQDGAYLVTDLNSSNGTFVKGRELEANESCPLNPGDELGIANFTYLFY